MPGSQGRQALVGRAGRDVARAFAQATVKYLAMERRGFAKSG